MGRVAGCLAFVILLAGCTPSEPESLTRYRAAAKAYCEEGAAACKLLPGMTTKKAIEALDEKTESLWARIPDPPPDMEPFHGKLKKARGTLSYIRTMQDIHTSFGSTAESAKALAKNEREAVALRKTFESLREEVGQKK